MPIKLTLPLPAISQVIDPDFIRIGKSGQQRATHRLTAGSGMFSGDTNHGGRERATENYRLNF